MRNTPINDSLQPIVRELIKQSVGDACDVVSDMSGDDPYMLTIDCIRETAAIMLQNYLDEGNHSLRLPAKLKNALNELIDAKVVFALQY